MRKTMSDMEDRHRTQIQNMKTKYEEEINTLRNEVVVLRDKITEYQRENGALHLLLRDRGIDPQHGLHRRSSKWLRLVQMHLRRLAD
jgi:hypothetical protein